MAKITIADNWILKVILKCILMTMFQQVTQAKFKQKLIDQILSPDKLMISINRKSLKTDQSF